MHTDQIWGCSKHYWKSIVMDFMCLVYCFGETYIRDKQENKYTNQCLSPCSLASTCVIGQYCDQCVISHCFLYSSLDPFLLLLQVILKDQSALWGNVCRVKIKLSTGLFTESLLPFFLLHFSTQFQVFWNRKCPHICILFSQTASLATTNQFI